MSIPAHMYVFILIEVIFVTYLDIKYKKIKNFWSLLNIILAIVLFVTLPQIYILSFVSFQYSIVFIFVGFLLYLLKIMGGGDSKFLASFFLIIPYEMQDLVFFYLLISTVIIGVLFFFRNIITKRVQLVAALKQKDLQGVKSCFGTKFAYAPVILITWIFTGIKYFL
ncbi:MAG: hypothetical protein CME62_02390 [Halobacteriovoraceae bacterium]|nr:hypothetical protein [Halobacteriovoraceae bacterium]|tara:strand:- start:25965 stop:26465 length:501 start_codon:yes stop_codon:yes gene_type:complete